MGYIIYPRLQDECRDLVDTNVAAHHLGLAPKTLRNWASTGSGPLLPCRKINGRHRFWLKDIKAIVFGTGVQ